MIRSDLANRIAPAAERPPRSVLPGHDITDKLPGLVAGQRLLAHIEALLPNGNYRASIGQRSVTLALPFVARSGDAIELEVAESNGRLTLAVVARASADPAASAAEASFTTSLSRTGQLIRDLIAGARDGRSALAALPLNENRPLAAAPPVNGRELLPLLENAIVGSGMFYEAHQAEWVEGRFSKTQLLLEPQGRLSPEQGPQPGDGKAAAADLKQTSASATTTAAPGGQEQALAPQARALVQQQLEAFATQVFSWQGQVWPGQQLLWQIDDPIHDRAGSRNPDSGSEQWQTRLRLTLPRLGEVEARLGVQGEQIALSIFAPEAATRQLLSGNASELRLALEEARLTLASLDIGPPPERPAHVQPTE